ncbi:MAG TPA: hypothetical protein VFX50_03495, partial [Gemmatimonadales bacterium]|nr:hypothetical protein [Gemmatimonadales bacterium]
RDVTLRWQARSEDRIVVRGTFDGQDGDSLRIDPEGPLDVFAVSWASISKLERHAGVRRHTGSFALAFGVPGALVGAIGGAAFCSGDYYCEAGPTANALKWGAILGAGSAALGALVGSAVVTDRWERIEAPLVVDPTVIHGRIGAAISLRF